MTIVIFPKHVSVEEALIKLWEAAPASFMGRLHSHKTPTIEHATILFEAIAKKEDWKPVDLQRQYVDYFLGKPIKTDFTNYPRLRSIGYDRDAGEGTMLKVSQECAEYIGSTPRLTKDEIQNLMERSRNMIEIYPRDEPDDPLQMLIEKANKYVMKTSSPEDEVEIVCGGGGGSSSDISENEPQLNTEN